MRITLSLKGSFQSWGSAEPWTASRKTELKPTESAIYGLLGCAMGVHKEGDEDKAAWIRANVKVIVPDPDYFTFNTSVVVTDDQIVSGLKEEFEFTCQKSVNQGKTGGKTNKMPQVKKEYLMDVETVVYLDGEKDVMDRVLDYLIHPVYPYYLGRACCVPSGCIIKKVEE
ncbi:MAG: type I-E CRISPR-associated protein Cas5/CasD [Lachnospiraceae bacterium]|nr:type I-E CRISPR-associated protein Cas5/CasD [Lachnospiraceae bacterium]